MITLKRTNSTDQDFIELVRKLDAELKERDGAENEFYAQFNKIDMIKHAVVAYENEVPIGCGAIKQFDEQSMEVKRMYVPKEARGKGVATKVLTALEKWASELNYQKCVLETGKRQIEALALYKKNGYQITENYGQYIGIENSVCFTKKIIIDYKSINKESWNNRTEVHYDSKFYDNKTFIKGRTSLNEIELGILSDVTGKSVLHLQCHFGQDTISFSRMGASATGVDLSDKAIDKACELATTVGTNTQFICCDIYDLPNHLEQTFDIVFTSYGTIGWLPDIDKWASVVSRFLKPKGEFYIVEFHPFVWMYDDDFSKIAYNYFNTGPIVETSEGTYTDNGASLKQEYVMWNHPISEVVNNLIKHGLNINSLDEFNYSPYNCFNKTIEFEPGKFRIEHMGDNIPMVYAIKAIKE